MSVLEIVLRLLFGVFLVGANAFFVLTEFALTRLRSLGEEVTEDHPGLERAWHMTEELEIYLTSCQLGITASSILLGVVAEPAVTHLIETPLSAIGLSQGMIHGTAVVLAVIAINLIHKIWGEQAPTYLGVERPRVAAYTAPVLYWWTKSLYYVIMAGDGLAKWTLGLFGVEIERSWTKAEAEEGEEGEIRSFGDLKRQMGEVLSRGRLSPERREEVLRALEIQEIPVREVMVPLEEVAFLSTERSFEENLEVLREEQLTRFPLVGSDQEDFRGIVYVPALAARFRELDRGEIALDEIAAEPLTVDGDCEVSRLIDLFQEERQELALVRVDGRLAGLVTATDAFETITGELEDPLD
ncbi:MAG: hemolysin family protein [Thermoanaerobaculia bacterium]|nr:hemolysin family protein [Thermoanaerobaculia bacterium]